MVKLDSVPKAKSQHFSPGGHWIVQCRVGNSEEAVRAAHVQSLFNSVWMCVGLDFCKAEIQTCLYNITFSKDHK